CSSALHGLFFYIGVIWEKDLSSWGFINTECVIITWLLTVFGLCSLCASKREINDTYEQRMSKTVTNITLENSDSLKTTNTQNINFILNPIPIRSVLEQVPFKNNFFPPILQEPLAVSYPLYIQPQIRKPESSVASELHDDEEESTNNENDEEGEDSPEIQTELDLPQSETSFSSRPSCSKGSSFDFFEGQASNINKTDSELALTSPYQENDPQKMYTQTLEISPANYSNSSGSTDDNHSDTAKTGIKKGRVEII
ncbi:hypothetical protein Anas_05376, partial [Armadillidium nasatum]